MLGDFRRPVQRIHLTAEFPFHSKTFPASFRNMSESKAPISNAPASAGAKPEGDVRRRHRGRRGGRGRRKPATPPAGIRPPANAIPPAEAEAATPVEETRPPEIAAEKPAPIKPAPAPLLERVQRLTERAAVVEPAHRGSAISQAIDEVMQIIEALKGAVDQMEDVLELVELAERQKLADEREIDALRRAMRSIHSRPEPRRGGDEPRRSGRQGRRNDEYPRRSAEAPQRGGQEPHPGEDEPQREAPEE